MKKLGYDYHISQGETFTIHREYTDVLPTGLMHPHLLVTIVSSQFSRNNRVIATYWQAIGVPGRLTVNVSCPTTDTRKWREQRYYYTVSLVDGEYTSTFLHNLCDEYGVPYGTNEEMYYGLISKGVVFNKEFNYNAALTNLTCNKVLDDVHKIVVAPMRFVMDSSTHGVVPKYVYTRSQSRIRLIAAPYIRTERSVKIV